jgi:hypothetical protein
MRAGRRHDTSSTVDACGVTARRAACGCRWSGTQTTKQLELTPTAGGCGSGVSTAARLMALLLIGGCRAKDACFVLVKKEH